MNIFKRVHTLYILHRHAIAHDLWVEVTEKLAFLQGMTAVEKAHLRELSTLFLHEKKFFGTHELQLTDAMCVTIAIQACLPVLGLGISCLSGWTEIIVFIQVRFGSVETTKMRRVLYIIRNRHSEVNHGREGHLYCHGTMLSGMCRGNNPAAMS